MNPLNSGMKREAIKVEGISITAMFLLIHPTFYSYYYVCDYFVVMTGSSFMYSSIYLFIRLNTYVFLYILKKVNCLQFWKNNYSFV